MLSDSFGFGTREDCRVLVVGLDNSGKTSIINMIKPGKVLLQGWDLDTKKKRKEIGLTFLRTIKTLPSHSEAQKRSVKHKFSYSI
jgi:GTPase SAR1 family protein